ncbi:MULTISPECIES: PQQ-binding-like beta-propeller repeat protein [unclassified Streptomyces]|uniref:outer membrane protein assembly factor BamB family protein n=1 Tax=unclassified Streptomyces TaxID=2593676 RepID=UPI00036A8F4B|nr:MULTISPECIES: PQQ-binding-like beta-propeller repeat protein [unclassified Streptomyces]MYY06013.1 PQQ-binding-like beta-propeller repeat protein [Streptomyces sp. SID4913]
MTQPPGQQPPQGGFGAPQEPPHGVPQPPQGPPQTPPPPAQPPQPPAAPPTPPPAQPGYGYPQQPGPYGQPQQPGPYGQPQQPGPYGQPQQQPGPYGQPQQPGPYGQQPQPGYGFPQQQYSGAPVPPGPGGPGGGPSKRKPAMIIGAAVAALLVIGGGVYFATSGGDDDDDDKPVAKQSEEVQKPSVSPSVDKGDGNGTGREDDDLNSGRKDGEAKVLWLQKNDVDLPRNGADVYGPWLVGDTVVKGMYRTMSAYAVADGTQKWTLKLPADICSAPQQTTTDGKIVIAIKNGTTDKADCSMLQLIDLNTGKAGWKKEVKKSGLFDMMSDLSMAISGDTVTAGRTGGSNAFRVSDGKELFGKRSGNCQPFAFAGGTKLIAATSCRTDDVKNPQHEIEEVDPSTGKPKWTYKPARGWEVDKVYSVSPLIVSLTKGSSSDDKKWSILALRENGTLRSQLVGDKGDKFAPDCGGAFTIFGKRLDGCTGVAADANTFYMATQDDTSGSARTNQVVAFNLNTGKPKWKAKAPAGQTVKPLGMESGNVLLYVNAAYGKGGGIATLSPSGGSPQMVLQHPDSTSSIESSFYNEKILYADGRSFVASGRVSASNDKEELETKTMMAFGK